jgi:hypothetical protein
MASRISSVPPRPLTPGDVVAAHCESLGEWSAAQITDLDQEAQTAGVLELDWSGPEPESVADLGRPAALRLTYAAYTRETPRGKLAHLRTYWLLPRGCEVIGAMPLLIDRLPLAPSYGYGWEIGRRLAYQRRWDTGDHRPWSDPREVTCTGAKLNEMLASPAGPRPDVWHLTATDVQSLDCALLTARYPGLTDLSLFGTTGTFGMLAHASSLNLLASLKRLIIQRLFGMGRGDCLDPDRVPALEVLGLLDIPYDYAAVMRTRWSPQIPGGTLMEITGARKPEWLAENMNNPVREGASGTCPERDPSSVSVGGADSDDNRQMKTDEMRTWAELFPGGRCIVYEGDEPGRFVREIKNEFGFDPSQDRRWGRGLIDGPNNADLHDPLGRPYFFHCPPEYLDAIYASNRWPMGS